MRLIKDYFTNSRAEARGLLVFLIIILSLLLVRFVILPDPVGFDLEIHAVPSEKEEDKVDVKDYTLEPVTDKKDDAFSSCRFDPNTAVPDELLARGFKSDVVNRIIRYRLKGGQFREGQDLLKIYGIDSNLVISLSKHISTNRFSPAVKDRLKKDHSRYTPCIELNRADSLQLKQVSGIGKVLSARIVRFRNLLGGFYSAKQLSEVYGITDSLCMQWEGTFTVDTSCIRKMNINTATADELVRHPYLSYFQAKAILSYRRLVGPFESKKQLVDNYLLSETDYLKVLPYLTLN
jgi:DNA uptake protein ComE-like DNA-binding protein